jgi:hypothetical protein
MQVMVEKFFGGRKEGLTFNGLESIFFWIKSGTLGTGGAQGTGAIAKALH